MKPNKSVREYLAECGRKGGLSRSPSKIEAGRRNIAKATAAKMKMIKKIVDKRLIV